MKAKKLKERKATFDSIMSTVPAQLSSEQLRFLLRALVYSNSYSLFEDVAVYYAELSGERNDQSDEEVLDDVIIKSTAKDLPTVLARIALNDHIDIPREEQIDFLAQATVLFLPKEETKPSTTKKKANALQKPAAKKLATKPAKK